MYPMTQTQKWDDGCQHSLKIGDINDNLLEALPICEWGDDKSVSTTKKLILINEIHICYLNNALICVLLEIKPCLFQPLKICGGFYMHPSLKKRNYKSIQIAGID